MGKHLEEVKAEINEKKVKVYKEALRNKLKNIENAESHIKRTEGVLKRANAVLTEAKAELDAFDELGFEKYWEKTGKYLVDCVPADIVCDVIPAVVQREMHSLPIYHGLSSQIPHDGHCGIHRISEI